MVFSKKVLKASASFFSWGRVLINSIITKNGVEV